MLGRTEEGGRMHGSSRTTKRLWRWRRNPLRRHDDIAEAWIVLAMWVVIAVGGAIAGLVTAHAAAEEFAHQRAERHSVQAVLLSAVPQDAPTVKASGNRVLAKVRWTSPDGTARSGYTRVSAGLQAGSRLTVWQDDRGVLTTKPTGPTEATAEAVLFGAAAALAVSGATLGAGAAVRWRLDQRRFAQWGREWDLVGPQWGGSKAG
ncbi:Rv1733c family protein [Streptomyces sp. SAS_270]|uniref:Rv1733c family protein n=1 Tax=Streptomyces sp. SAS_270 TaxID=3412748 RepID=UPI00403C9D9D